MPFLKYFLTTKTESRFIFRIVTKVMCGLLITLNSNSPKIRFAGIFLCLKIVKVTSKSEQMTLYLCLYKKGKKV